VDHLTKDSPISSNLLVTWSCAFSNSRNSGQVYSSSAVAAAGDREQVGRGLHQVPFADTAIAL
jgi:hypothetical protein